MQFLEPVGSDLYLTVEVGGTSVQVRTDPDSPLAAGRERERFISTPGVCTSSARTVTTSAATRRPVGAAAAGSSPPRRKRDGPSIGSGRGRGRLARAGLQSLLRDLIAFRTESQAKEATHFPGRGSPLHRLRQRLPVRARLRDRRLGRRPVGDVRRPPAHRRAAAGLGRRPLARVQRRTSTSSRSGTAARGRRIRSAARSSTAASTAGVRPI